MKRAALILAVLVVVGFVGYLGWQTLAAREQAGAPATPGPDVDAGADANADVIWASGKLTPATWTGLSTASSGAVKTVHVVEGDRVEAGDLLLELNSAALQSQIEVARAALREAEAASDRLLAPATDEQVAEAEAAVALARANVQSAQAAVETALRAVEAADAQVAIARAQYGELASRPTEAEKVAAQREIDLAYAALKQAQQAYDRVRGDPDIAMRPEALALEQATLRFDSAQAVYDVATQGATTQQLAVANAQITAAQAQAQVAGGRAPAAESAVGAAQAQLAQAEAALRARRIGATDEDKAIAESRVGSARAALAAAEAQLAEAQVRAPFAGQVGSVSIRPGELAVPGQVLLMLGDTGTLRVETTDLRETDVARLTVGMPAEVTFDALPNRTFQGVVSRIAAMSTTDRGSTNYTLVIEVADLDPALRWGMTAFVNLRGD